MKRYSELHCIEEIKELHSGMDFRLPQYRREVFMRFYKFNLKYKALPGGVYYLLPYLSKICKWTKEQQLWFCFINGCTQNPLTSWVIFNNFPEFDKIDINQLEKWHRANWKNLDYDIDRRYCKGHFVEMYESYLELLSGYTQEQFFHLMTTKANTINFLDLWECINNELYMFGRLSTFSYLEYLSIIGINIWCTSLFLEDKSGSKSHRNGLCKVLGRDDLDWHKSNPECAGHTAAIINWLQEEGYNLIQEARERFKNEPFLKDVNYFTLESCLCSYKSMFRPNRRYPNVYNDMLYDRIVKAQKRTWNNISFDIFWHARKECLPAVLRCEDVKGTKGLCKIKQNHFRLTGKLVHMGIDDEAFTSTFNKQLTLI